MEKMNFKNLDFYECPICGKRLFMYFNGVNSHGNGYNFFNCEATRKCKNYAAVYKIKNYQRMAVKYYDSNNGDNVYEKAYKMVGDNDESK